MTDNIEAIIRESVTSTNVFKTICARIANLECATLKDVKHKNKKIGDLWEDMCKHYLLRILNFQTAHLLRETTEDQLHQYGMKRRDVGIDLICIDQAGKRIAVQCKFRSRGNVSWKQVSTFEALCARTGPWDMHMIMTNSPRVVREGTPHEKDCSIAQPAFNRIRRHEWLLLAGCGSGNVCSDQFFTPPSLLQLRELRTQHFEWLGITKNNSI